MTVVRLSSESFTTTSKTERQSSVCRWVMCCHFLQFGSLRKEWYKRDVKWQILLLIWGQSSICTEHFLSHGARNNWAVVLHVWPHLEWIFPFCRGTLCEHTVRGVDKRSDLSASFAQQDVVSTKENDIQNCVSFKREKKENQSELNLQNWTVSMTTETMQSMCPQKNQTSNSRHRRIAWVHFYSFKLECWNQVSHAVFGGYVISLDTKRMNCMLFTELKIWRSFVEWTFTLIVH